MSCTWVHHDRHFTSHGAGRRLLAVSCSLVLLMLCSVALAAESKAQTGAGAVATYQVVNGTDDKAYLVNTASGFVWVLTYRTTATGREPVAIPYKFIRICPGNSKEFLVEDAKDGVCLPTPGR